MRVDDPRVGPVTMIDVMPKLSKTPGRIRWAGPEKGAHNREIFAELLGLDSSAMQALADAGVI